jgi:septal ring factor EnvC (AmiA/AmiB activator)
MENKPSIDTPIWDDMLKKHFTKILAPASIEKLKSFISEWEQFSTASLQSQISSLSAALKEKEGEIALFDDREVVWSNKHAMLNERVADLQKELEYWGDCQRYWRKHSDEQAKELTKLREWIEQVDKSLYAGEDLKDEEILAFYIDVWKLIKEEAKQLLAETNPHPEK